MQRKPLHRRFKRRFAPAVFEHEKIYGANVRFNPLLNSPRWICILRGEATVAVGTLWNFHYHLAAGEA